MEPADDAKLRYLFSSVDMSMIIPDLLQPLRETLEKAHELVRLAQAEEWSALEEQFMKYEQLTKYLNDEEYLKTLTDNNLGESAKEIILQIQALNESLDLRANNVMNDVASELRQMMQSDKAMDAYRR